MTKLRKLNPQLHTTNKIHYFYYQARIIQKQKPKKKKKYLILEKEILHVDQYFLKIKCSL